MKFIVRSLLSLSIIGSAYLCMEVSKRYLMTWTLTNRNDDLVAYARWETASLAVAVLGVVVFIWAYVSTRKD